MQTIRVSAVSKAVAVRPQPARSVSIVPARICASRSVLARAAAEDDSAKQMAELSAKAQESVDAAVKPILAEWDATPESEKPAAVAIIFFVVLAQIAIGSTVDAIDRIPVVNSILELIGAVVTFGYAYKYFSEPEERTSVQANIDSFVKAVKGA